MSILERLPFDRVAVDPVQLRRSEGFVQQLGPIDAVDEIPQLRISRPVGASGRRLGWHPDAEIVALRAIAARQWALRRGGAHLPSRWPFQAELSTRRLRLPSADDRRAERKGLSRGGHSEGLPRSRHEAPSRCRPLRLDQHFEAQPEREVDRLVQLLLLALQQKEGLLGPRVVCRCRHQRRDGAAQVATCRDEVARNLPRSPRVKLSERLLDRSSHPRQVLSKRERRCQSCEVCQTAAEPLAQVLLRPDRTHFRLDQPQRGRRRARGGPRLTNRL